MSQQRHDAAESLVNATNRSKNHVYKKRPKITQIHPSVPTIVSIHSLRTNISS